MTKWQSKAEIEAQNYRRFYREAYPILEQAMQEYVASYDESQPVEESMKTLSPNSLLERRISKYCVWPLVRERFASAGREYQSNLVGQSLDQFMQPLREARRKQQREEEKVKQAILKQRQSVLETMSDRGHTPGEYVYFMKERQVLLCIESEYVPGFADYGTFTGGYAVKFAEPTEEEKLSPEYLRSVETMNAKIAYEEELRRQARNKADAGEWD